ncbi:MAG: DinB family protein [Sphingobacteriaceae bacterium]
MHSNLLEVWQRGPLPEIPSLLQPVAHALLQAREEVEMPMAEFPSALLWEKPAGCASVGFHLQHLSGVLDRVFTYARDETLTEHQFADLALEGKGSDLITTTQLVQRFHLQVDLAMEQIKATAEGSLTEFRGVGRNRLPSTVIGLLFHGAEHTMRHVGQLLVTAKVLVHII